MTITTKPCIMCGKTSALDVKEDEYKAWQAGALIQRAMPSLCEDDRELLITGTHPDCWESMFVAYDPENDCMACGGSGCPACEPL